MVLTLLLLSTLNDVFLYGNPSYGADITDQQLWRIRLESARERLQHAGISVTDDLLHSVATYLECRGRWDDLVHRIGRSMAYEASEIDPAMQRK